MGYAKDFAGLAVGDVLPPSGSRVPLVEPGAPVWIALRVQSQHEDQVEAWLALRGVYAFHPVLMRRTRVKGRARDYARRYLPGYVFARFPGLPLVARVMACPWITGALCGSGGGWAVLEPADLRALHGLRRIDAAQAAAARARAVLRPGDRALFRAGPLAGQPCEVADLKGAGGVVVRLRLFGGDMAVTTTAADLVVMRGGVDSAPSDPVASAVKSPMPATPLASEAAVRRVGGAGPLR